MTSFLQVVQRINFAAFGVITAFESYIASGYAYLNPGCFGLRMLWIWIYLFNLECKIDVNNFPRQLVKVIPL